MQTQIGKINDHFNRDIWWGKVTVTSDDNLRETEVFVCVSEEYLMENFNTKDLNKDQISLWFKDVCDIYKNANESIFDNKYNSVVYATTEDGKENGYDFLKNEIIPKYWFH